MKSFDIEPLDSGDHGRVTQFMSGIFCDYGALHQCLDIKTNEYEPILRPVLERIASDGLSFVARNTDNNRIIGAILACDYLTPTDVDSERLPKIRPLSALLSRLTSLHSSVNPLGRGEALLVDMAATDPEYRGAGIYRTLRETVHRAGKTAGFRVVYGELSAAGTQHVCVRQFGHVVRAEIAYRDFEFEGQRPFASVTAPPTVQLVEGSL